MELQPANAPGIVMLEGGVFSPVFDADCSMSCGCKLLSGSILKSDLSLTAKCLMDWTCTTSHGELRLQTIVGLPILTLSDGKRSCYCTMSRPWHPWGFVQDGGCPQLAKICWTLRGAVGIGARRLKPLSCDGGCVRLHLAPKFGICG